MTRAGRAVGSSITLDSTEAQELANLRGPALYAGLPAAAIAAFRTAVPVRRIAGRSTFHGTQVLLQAESLAVRRAVLEDRAEAEHHKAVRARTQEINARDDDEANMYQERARTAEDARKTALAELAALDTAPAKPTSSGPFDAYVDVFVPALARLATCSNELTQKESQALDRLMPDLVLKRRDDGVWWASAKLLINTVDGVGELGPIEWPVGTGGFGTGQLRAQVDMAKYPNTGSRTLLKHQLTEAGLTSLAAQTLINAPLPQLAHVVLYAKAGVPCPGWVSAQWHDPVFVAWVTARYADPNFTWMGSGRYTQVDPFRQAIATFAARHGGPFTLTDLRKEVMVLRNELATRAARPEEPGRRAKKGMSYWLPCIRTDFYEKRIYEATTMEGILCECGEYADHTLKAPEVPRTLVCDCGRMVDAAEFGMPEELRFPDEYRDLKLDYDVARALTVQRFSPPPERWKGRHRDILRQERLLAEGVSRTDLATALGTTVPNLASALESLVNRGLLQQEKVGRRQMMSYTTAGRELAAQLRDAV
jgi:predicted transcriptional regulator